MASFNFYRVQANHYIRIVRVSDNAVYDNVAGVFDAAPTWAASAITLTWDAVIEGYPVNMPVLAVGDYDICFYDNSVPASGDEVLYGQDWRVV